MTSNEQGSMAQGRMDKGSPVEGGLANDSSATGGSVRPARPLTRRVLYHLLLWCCVIVAASLLLDLVSPQDPRPGPPAIGGKPAELASRIANGHQVLGRVLVGLQLGLACSLLALCAAAAIYYRVVRLPRAHRAIAAVIDRMRSWASPRGAAEDTDLRTDHPVASNDGREPR
ncbi:MAG: hypothetical protein ACT60Q_00440 [Ferrovibrionaceae bacterium]